MKIKVHYENTHRNHTHVSDSFKSAIDKHYRWLCEEGIVYENWDDLPFTEKQFKDVVKFLNRKANKI
jgi:hypothetical protein